MAVACLARLFSQGIPSISIVTHLELLVGCADSREARQTERFLRRFAEIPVDSAVSARALDLIRSYRLSHGLLIPDALIAATAMEAGLPLVSKNQRDYRFISGLSLPPYP